MSTKKRKKASFDFPGVFSKTNGTTGERGSARRRDWSLVAVGPNNSLRTRRKSRRQDKIRQDNPVGHFSHTQGEKSSLIRADSKKQTKQTASRRPKHATEKITAILRRASEPTDAALKAHTREASSTYQGPLRGVEFMRLRLTDASSSDIPPDKNMTPGTAAGTWRSKTVTVVAATSSGVGRSVQSAPGQVMEGLRREPSRYTPFSEHALYTAARTFSCFCCFV